MRFPKIDRVLHSLLCVRLGQELGTSSDAAQAIAAGVELLIKAAAAFLP
jgi:hypothetical protein